MVNLVLQKKREKGIVILMTMMVMAAIVKLNVPSKDYVVQSAKKLLLKKLEVKVNILLSVQDKARLLEIIPMTNHPQKMKSKVSRYTKQCTSLNKI